jgi:hypothetical protein
MHVIGCRMQDKYTTLKNAMQSQNDSKA